MISTKGAGAVIVSSDPGLTVQRTSPGNITVTASNPIATNITRVCVIATSNDTLDVACTARGISNTAFQVISRVAGAPADCTLNLSWFGT